jgi:hypothetical protein
MSRSFGAGFVDMMIEFTVPVHRTAVILGEKRDVYSVAAYLFHCNIYEIVLFFKSSYRITW